MPTHAKVQILQLHFLHIIHSSATWHILLVLMCDELERKTSGQNTQPEWKDKPITGSVCGKVLPRSSHAVAREIVYPKPPRVPTCSYGLGVKGMAWNSQGRRQGEGICTTEHDSLYCEESKAYSWHQAAPGKAHTHWKCQQSTLYISSESGPRDTASISKPGSRVPTATQVTPPTKTGHTFHQQAQ